jgi:hypothetical protein
LLGATVVLAQAGPTASWHRDPHDPRWLYGQVDLATSADSIWERIVDVPRWPALFSDIASFSIRSRSEDGTRWVARIDSKTFERGVQDYVVTLNASARTARVVFSTMGVTAAAYASVVTVGGGRARARYSLFVETHGIAGWFVSEADLRARQERLVQRTLGDLERVFGTYAVSAR